MNFINHITLNTGHIRQTYPTEVDKSIYFILKRIYKDSFQKKGASLFGRYTMKSTKSDYGVLITVFNDDSIPILTTGISDTDDGTLWDLLHTSATTPLKTSKLMHADTPYIADRLEVGALISLHAMEWTGDFSKCMSWIVLSPKQIR